MIINHFSAFFIGDCLLNVLEVAYNVYIKLNEIKEKGYKYW